MSMMVVTHLGPHGEVHQRTQRSYGGNIGVGGVIPHHTTPMSLISNMAEMDQITGRFFIFGPMTSTANKAEKHKPSTHGDKGWGCAKWGATPRT